MVKYMKNRLSMCLFMVVFLCCGCSTTYECIRCKTSVEEAYYDPFKEDTYYCEECAKKYFSPLPYESYKVGSAEADKEKNYEKNESIMENKIVRVEVYEQCEGMEEELWSTFVSEYDERDRLVRQVEYGNDYTTIEFLYDESNRVSNKIVYDNYGMIIEETTITYLGDCKRSECTILNNGGITERIYDEKGNILSYKQYLDGSLIQYGEVEYDDRGNRIHDVSSYTPFEEVNERFYTNTYGIMGNILESESTDGVVRAEYKYDKNCNLIEEYIYENEEIAIERYYTYDSQNRLIETREEIYSRGVWEITKYFYE